MISFSCPGCQKKLSVRDDLAGKKAKCPGCGQVTPIPGAVAVSQPVEDMRTVLPSAADGKSPARAAPLPMDAPTIVPSPTRDANPPTLSSAGESADTFAGPVRIAAYDTSLTEFLMPPQSKDELGRLGPYRILRILGHGGMGVVYQAEDTKLKRTVALKAMLPSLAVSAGAGQRFQREAESMAALEHDHIVRIYQVAEDRGVPFMAMEFLKGESLDDRLKRDEKLPVSEVVRIGREIAEALDAAHATGLIHRDIKPANIWLEMRGEGRGARGEKNASFALAPLPSSLAPRVKILDFGLARAASQEAGLTQQGAIIGTPAFMAPEQARGENVDARCDLFSLGIVLYRLCSGKLPFRGKDTVSTLMEVAMHEPAPPIELNADVPSELSELIMKLLQKDPLRRPEAAAEVVLALRSLEAKLAQRTSPALTPIEPVQPRSPRSSQSGKGPFVAMAFAAVAALLAGIVFFWPTQGGVIRIEIDDPDIEAIFTKNGPTLKLKDKQEIKVTPGEFGLHIKRGDLEFDTNMFVLKNGETITLKIEWFKEGKLQVVQGDKVIGAKERPKVVDGPTAGAVDYVLLFDGQTSVVEIPSLHVAGLKEWCVEARISENTDQGIATVASEGSSMNLWRAADHTGFAAHGLRISGSGYRVTHLAAVCKGDELRLFVNGIKSRQEHLKNPDAADAAEPFRLGATRLDLKKGLERFFKGTIDEVRISRVARYGKDFTPAKRFEPDADTLALYHCDEGEGDVLKDSSGNGHDGKIVGAKWVKADESPVLPPPHPSGDYAVRFTPGTTVEIPAWKLAQSETMTFEAYVTIGTGIDKAGQLMSGGTGIGQQYSLSIANQDFWHFGIVKEDATVIKGKGEIGQRVHIAAIRTDGELRLYKDGKLLGTKNIGANGALLSERQRFPGRQQRTQIVLGGAAFAGVVDEIRISDIARYDNDFTPARHFKTDANTLALYHCDEGAGDVLKDSSGHDRHAKLVGGNWVKADGSPIVPSPSGSVPDVALAFEAGGALTIAKNTFADLDSFTLEGWFLLEKQAIPNAQIMSAGGRYLGVNFSQNSSFYVSVAPKSKGKANLKSEKATFGRWTHLVWVSTGDKNRLFVDGNLMATGANDIDKTTVKLVLWSKGLAGSMKEVRLSKSARYDKDFTPARRFEPDADTLALYHCDEGKGEVLHDSSGYERHGKIVGGIWMKGDTRLITPPPPPADPFVALFDGKDLTGWTKEKGEKSEKSIWKVEDGAMTCTGARSHLFFQDSFTDFHLRVEARINSGGNSGVFFRAQNNTPWPLGYEAQIALDKDAYRTGSLHGVVKLTEDLILPDTWFTMEVIAVGPRIRILLDGKEVVNYVDVTPKARSKGQIALQQNGAATRVLFRKIEIKPLKADASAAAPLDPGWLALVAKMAPEEQVEAVKAELMKRNPDFDGKIENQKIQGNVVTELAFAGTNVTDISPVRALTGLQKLKCDSPPTKKGRLADLSPLTGTKLTWLSVSNTQVADLTPLKDLKLTFLWIPGTKVTDLKALQDMKSTLTQLHFGHTSIDDLTPLKNMQLTNLDFVVTPVADLKPLTGMPLTFLSCDFTRVSDLSPLKGMQLTKIRCEKAKVTDLSWLKGMPLKEIACDFRAERDVEILRSITTLEKINGQDAKQLLK